MKIAFVCQTDSRDIHGWSGIPFFIVKALRERGHQVTEISPLKPLFEIPIKIATKLLSCLLGKHIDMNRIPIFTTLLSRQVKKKLTVMALN